MGTDAYPLEALSPHSTLRSARQADTGLAHHKAIPLDDFAAVPNQDLATVEPAAAARPVWDWAAANQRKVDAVRQLAPLADAIDDLEARIEALAARTKGLELA